MQFIKNTAEGPGAESVTYTILDEDTKIRLNTLSMNDLITLDSLGQLNKIKDGVDRVDWIEKFYWDYNTVCEDFDSYLIGEMSEDTKNSYKADNINYTINYKVYDEDNDKFESYTYNTMDDGKDYPEHNSEIVLDKIKDEIKNKHLGEVVQKYDFQNWIKDEVEQIEQNRYIILDAYVPEHIRKYLNEVGLTVIELLDLNRVFNSFVAEVDTYKPYIKNVVRHWYKDVYFMDDSDGFTTYDTDVTEEIDDDFMPSGETTNPKIDYFLQRGTFHYNGKSDSGFKDNEYKSPRYVKDEPWHYKVKNWVQYGYYFLYDGTEETAIHNEIALKWLQTQGYYDSTNPLLLDKYKTAAKESETEEEYTAHTALGVSGSDAAEIDKRAKEINEILAANDFRSRLQKIDFKKSNSLTAFSILERVHTEDSEVIYSMLKDFLVELGYFKYADFAQIQTDVFKWLIPDYEVYKGEWPDKKYEKLNTDYGSYIRSKKSLTEQRAYEAEIAEKETEEMEKNSTSRGTNISNTYKNVGNAKLVQVGKECWEYVVNSGKYTYENKTNKQIPLKDGSIIDCSSFVSWILYEAGYDDFKGGQKTSDYFMNTNFKNLYGWTEIKVNGDCTSKVEPGDIVARSGHVTFVKSVDNSGKVLGYDCGDQSFWSKSNINGVDITHSAINVAGSAKIIRISSTDHAAVTIDMNSENTQTIAGIQLTDVSASDFGEEGFATITTVNGISYKNYKQGSYPAMGVSSVYSQTALPGCSDTFGYVGCGPTSTAIVLSAYGVEGKTGTDALPYVCGKLCGTYDGGTNSCYNIKNAFDHYNVPATVYNTGSATIRSTIDNALKEGKPIVANVNGGYYSPGGHYITVLGYDKDENLVISNPCGSEIYGVCGGYSVRGGVTLDYFINNCLGGGSGTCLIPDNVPTGFSYAGESAETMQKVEGFESGLDIIMPENGKIIEIGSTKSEGKSSEDTEEEPEETKEESEDEESEEEKIEEHKALFSEGKIDVTGDYVLIQFQSTGNGVKNWKMKIEGFALDKTTIKENKFIKKGAVIGITTDSNMKVTLYNEKDAIINDVEDYFVLEKRDAKKRRSSESQEYPYDKDEVELLARLIQGETPPEALYNSICKGWDLETCMDIGKVTGYCCINYALEHDMTITHEIYGEEMYFRYGRGMSVQHGEISADCMECAEWCFEYDCGSVTNPDGVPMTRSVQGQSGWDLCPGSNNHGVHKELKDLNCWWVIDWPGRGTPGAIEDYDQIGDYCDLFYCYTELP